MGEPNNKCEYSHWQKNPTLFCTYSSCVAVNKQEGVLVNSPRNKYLLKCKLKGSVELTQNPEKSFRKIKKRYISLIVK